jgi:hypothetical protein
MIHEIMEDGPRPDGAPVHIKGSIKPDPLHPGQVIETITSEPEPIGTDPLAALMEHQGFIPL